MGNIYHSKKAMAKACEIFAEEALSKLTKHVSSQPCTSISLLADKVVYRRIVDFTAVMMVLTRPQAK